MSIHKIGEPDRFTMDIVGPACGMCFYCGREIQDVAVIWHGHTVADDPIIALHPECAQRLALHLAKDGLAGERATAGKDPAAGIKIKPHV
jgi:hypothetical protein